MFKAVLLVFLSFFLISCQTIHYVNSESEIAPTGHYEHVKWHHIGLWGLWEYSPPVNVEALCGDKGWKQVRTQRNILQVLVTGVLPSILKQINDFLALISWYTPEEVSVSCGSAISTS